MGIFLKRVLLLAALAGIAFLFTRSEQFGTTESKIVSLDFSKSGEHLAVATNHARWNYDVEFNRSFTRVDRRVRVMDVVNGGIKTIHEEPVPFDFKLQETEWERILGESPNNELGLLPFSPVQFLGESNRLAFYDFETGMLLAEDIQTGSRDSLAKLADPLKKLDPTLGWFLVCPDEETVLIEDQEDFELYRFKLNTNGLEDKVELGEPFYTDSTHLSLGPFVDLRMLPTQFSTPRPIYSSNRHPKVPELAVATVLQACFMSYEGKIYNRFISHRLKVGSMMYYSPDAKHIIAIQEDLMRVFNVEERETKKLLTNAEQGITAFAFSPDNKRFATGDNEGVVRIWDRETFDCLQETRLSGEFRVQWYLPYLCGFFWLLIFILTSSPKQPARKFGDRSHEEKNEDALDATAELVSEE